MKTKKAAVTTSRPAVRKETPDSDGPRRYTLRPTPYEIAETGEPSDYDQSIDARIYGIRTRSPQAHDAAAPWKGQGTHRLTGNPHSARRAFSTTTAANRAQPDRPDPQYIPQTMRPENPFRQKTAATAKTSRHKVAIPSEFIEWAERQGFAPAAAARFVLAWFCERESVDKHSKVQYTCANTAWPTNAPRTKKM